jgi:2',3'-cyclic-nucleotide 2'-phosphodiesterase (5'-nucleotidase family)
MRDKYKNILLLDAGNVFSGPGLQPKLKADVSLNAMAIMQYDFLNLSNKEFVFGADFILETLDKYSVPAVSANIVDEGTDTPIVASSKVITFDSFSVGITGIVAKKYESDLLNANDNESQSLTVLDEVSVLQEEVSRLQEEADVIVVLANVGLEAAKDIAREIDHIDVIVAGHGADQPDVPMYINGTYIVKAGYFGQTVGNLTLFIDENNKIVDSEGAIVTLDKSIEEDPEILDLMYTYHKSLEQYKEELFDIEQVAPDSGGYYTGTDVCMQCHTIQHDTWNESKHAVAINALVSSGQEYNPECVGCHVTGIGYTGGFERPDLTPDKAGVQCEMCHGPGGEHVKTYLEPYGEVTEKICIKCHTTEKDPGFDFDTDKELVNHKAGEL